MGIANSNMAYGYRLTPDVASQILATSPLAFRRPVPRLPRTDRLAWLRRPPIAERD